MNHSDFGIQRNCDFPINRDTHSGRTSAVAHLDQHAHKVIEHKVHSHLEEDVSDFAFRRLQEIAHNCDKEPSWNKRQKLVKLAGDIVEKFERVHYRKGCFAKIFHRIMVTLHLRHSEQEIRILHRAIKAPSMGGRISPDLAAILLEEHRHPRIDADAYDKVALTGVFFENRFKEMLQERAETLKSLEEPGLSIFKAHLKELCIKEVYAKELPKRIGEGCYHPSVIPLEVNHILGPVTRVAWTKLNQETLPLYLEAEVYRYAAHLSPHQINYIKADVQETIQLYLRAYPSKTVRNAFILGRDLIRFSVYQEIFDKASFTGSDHGSKHIHHNIENANSLHDAMDQHVDYSDKDKLLERLIHFFHDVGYTVGLASKSFSCCKDHPLIGAKMIEENRDYFEYYLDKEATDVLWNGILLHAIAMPNLTPDVKQIAGMYPNMVRAVTSISDACAVTYDRKTQEFWEHPVALIALSRLRLFLTQYPQYMAKLAPLNKGEWECLDKNNPLDILAHDVFQNTKRILLQMVQRSDIPLQKKELFNQAILQQFNSFTTTTTLGQLGGELIGVSALKNETLARQGQAPKFYPQFDLAPSLIYGTLHDVFGEDIALASFKKLTDEFSGDVGKLAKEVDHAVNSRELHQSHAPSVIATGNARFKIHNQGRVDPANAHLNEMQSSLGRVIEKVEKIARTQYMSLSEKKQVIQNLTAFRHKKLPGLKTFSDFISSYVLPNLSMHQSIEAAKDIEFLTQIVEEDAFVSINQADALWQSCFEPLLQDSFLGCQKDVHDFKVKVEQIKLSLTEKKGEEKLAALGGALIEAICKSSGLEPVRVEAHIRGVIHKILENAALFIEAEKHFFSIENALKLALMSEEEYRFMRGKRALQNKAETLTQMVR